MTEYHCKYDELADPNTLINHPRNHNKHPRRQLDALSAVIWGPKIDGQRDASKALGWRHAVVVSRLSGFVVMGHARKAVGIEEGELVPVVFQGFASEALERAQLAADNKLAELAEMDVELLNVEIKELEVMDIPVLDFGFDLKQVQKLNNGVYMDTEPLTVPDEPRVDSTMDRIALLFHRSIAGDILSSLRKIREKHGDEKLTWKMTN